MSAFTLRRRDRRDAHLCKPHSHRGSRAAPFERTKQRHRIVVVIVVELGWAAPSAAPTEFLLFSSGSNPRDAAKRLPFPFVLWRLELPLVILSLILKGRLLYAHSEMYDRLSKPSSVSSQIMYVRPTERFSCTQTPEKADF
jgi:hypothetical protein